MIGETENDEAGYSLLDDSDPSVDKVAPCKPEVGGCLHGWASGHLTAKPAILLQNSLLYLMFLAWFGLVQLWSKSSSTATATHYWEFSIGLLVLSYIGTAGGILFAVSLNSLAVRDSATESEAKAVLLAAVRRFHLSHSFYHTKLRSPRGPQVFMVDFLFFEKGGAADENGFGDD